MHRASDAILLSSRNVERSERGVFALSNKNEHALTLLIAF
jgi:hypothetical protein